jgi:hypothetical protein
MECQTQLQSPVLHEMKQHKPLFDEELCTVLDRMKSAANQMLEDPNEKM